MGFTAAPGSGLSRADLLERGRDSPRRRRGTASVPPDGRPILRLVPPLPAHAEDPRAVTGPAEDLRNRPRGQVRTPVRLTRRGRVVVGIVLAALVAGIVLLFAAPGSAAATTGPPRPVVVHAGDTLWSLAERAAPHRSVLATMREIQILNHMGDGPIYVGQLLLLPPAG